MSSARPPLRAFVVDDNHLIRRLLGMMLERAGVIAVELESGAEALELGTAEPPDVWLVDEVMPGMTGSELIRLIRRSRDLRVSRAAIVGMSGREGAAGDLLSAGADAFVTKPVDERKVIEAIARARASRGPGPEHLPAA
jgi:CheY-like chemotaxis protein